MGSGSGSLQWGGARSSGTATCSDSALMQLRSLYQCLGPISRGATSCLLIHPSKHFLVSYLVPETGPGASRKRDYCMHVCMCVLSTYKSKHRK